MKKGLKIIGLVILGFIALAIIISLIPGGQKQLEDTKSQLEQKNQQLEQKIEEQKGSIEDKSPAFKLAALQSNNQTSPPQKTIGEFEAILTSLDSKCTEDDQLKIADYIVFSRKKLEEKNVQLTYLEVASGINNSIPAESSEDVSCAEIATAFVLMTNSK